LPIERLNATYATIKYLAYRGAADRQAFMAFRQGKRGGTGILINDTRAHEKMQELDRKIGKLSAEYEYWLEMARGITIG
jgi:hypothetical protein